MDKIYSPIMPKNNNWIPPNKKIATIIVGIPDATLSLFNKNEINVIAAPINPIIENINPNNSANRAGIRLVETNPLIAWSIRSIKLFLDFPFLRLTQV